MSELGCLRDAHFNNLQIDGKLVSSNPATDISQLIRTEVTNVFSGVRGGIGNLRRTHIANGIAVDLDAGGDVQPPDKNSGNTTTGAGINFFEWTSRVRLFSYNIGAQTITNAIPQRTTHGFDIAGDQTDGSGRSYTTRMTYANLQKYGGNGNTDIHRATNNNDFTYPVPPVEETTLGCTARFVVEIPDISGVDQLMFGIRDITQDFQDTGSNYTNFAAFTIETGTGKIAAETKGTVSSGGSALDKKVNLTSPSSGVFNDNEVWEFQVTIYSHTLSPEFRCRRLDIMGDFRVQDIGEVPTFRGTDLRTARQVTFAPFIHCVQKADLSPVILHSLSDDRVNDVNH